MLAAQAQAELATVLEGREHALDLDGARVDARREACRAEALEALPDHAHALVRRSGEQHVAMARLHEARAGRPAAAVVVGAHPDRAGVGRVAVEGDERHAVDADAVDLGIRELHEDRAVERPAADRLADLVLVLDAAQQHVVAAVAQVLLDAADDRDGVRAHEQAVVLADGHECADDVGSGCRETARGDVRHVAEPVRDLLHARDGLLGDAGALAVHDVRDGHDADARGLRDVAELDGHRRTSATHPRSTLDASRRGGLAFHLIYR